MMRFVWIVALGVAACGAPHVGSDKTRLANRTSSTSLNDAASVSPTPEPVSSASSATPAPVWTEVVQKTDRTVAADGPEIGAQLLPPDDAACFFRGTGDPFSNNCPRSISVSSNKSGTVDLGRFDARRVDITWAFFKGKGRSWVGVRSAGLTLTGFVDTKAEHFRLARQATVIEGHVWFHDGASVLVKAGTEHGVDLAVDDDTPGVDRLVSHESCDALSFDLQPITSRGTAPLRSTKGAHFEAPVRGDLPLRAEPDGRIFTTLSNNDSGALGISLEVKQVLGDYKRVEFDTKSAHFDVWVKTRDVDDQHGFGSSGIGFGRCGSSGGSNDAGLIQIMADTPISVVRSPLGKGPEGISIAHGTEVRVEKRENGFARIVQPFGSIFPPSGSFFWVPESALETAPPANKQ